jgi:hypothetical protein
VLKKCIYLLLLTFLLFVGFWLFKLKDKAEKILMSGAPLDGLSQEEFPGLEKLAWLADWQRPDKPVTVGLQVGHLDNDKLPDELEKHRGSTGSNGGGLSEVEINLMIVNEAAKILKQQGIKVDIIPATIPVSYWADAFVAVHTDGSLDPGAHGFKVAYPWKDFTGDADLLVDYIKKSYQGITELAWDDNISRNMRGYYAFAFWKYDHSLHPMTTAAIIETGFLTNYSDRSFLMNNPDLAASGIADGILQYLQSENLLNNLSF